MNKHGPNTVLYIEVQMIDENDIMFIFIFLSNYPSHPFSCGNTVLYFLQMFLIRDAVFLQEAFFSVALPQFRDMIMTAIVSP